MRRIFIIVSLSLLITGCASQSHELKTANVSTTGYKGFTCPELQGELQTNINRTSELGTILDEKASKDEAQMALGMLLFWPALFALEGGDGVEAAEYSRLKGEINAMEQVAITKQCDEAKLLAQQYRENEAQARKAIEEEKNKVQNRTVI